MDKFNSCQGNSKSTWKSINSILGRNKKSNTPISVQGSEDTKMCDAFNNYFTNIGTTLADTIENTEDYRTYMNPPTNYSMYLAPVTESEIENYINALKPTAAGIDDIPATILKAALPSILPVITFLIKLSFQTGIFPEKLKIAKVIPVQKSGDLTLLQNHRPVSVLPSLSKIFERAIAVRLTLYMETNSLFTKSVWI